MLDVEYDKIDFVHRPSLLKGTIKTALDQVKNRCELIILFGSLSSGNFQIKSDVDLLIVGEGVELQEIRSILDPILTEKGIYYDLLLLSMDEFIKRLQTPIIQEAVGGVTLWESEKITNMMPSSI